MRGFTTLFFLLLVSLLFYPLMAYAEAQGQPLQLFLNGKQLTAEVAPQITKDGSTIVPVRIIAQSLGSKVKWEEPTRMVTIEKANMNIQMFIDKKHAIVNDKAVTLETAPTVIDGNTMLPVRFISEQLGVKVSWDELTRSVFLYNSVIETNTTSIPATNAVSTDNLAVKDQSKDQSKDQPKDQPSVKQPLPATAADVLGSKSMDAAQAKPTDKSTSIPEGSGSKPLNPGAKNDASLTAAKPITTSTNNPPGSAANLTTIQSISVENEQLIVRINGGKPIPNVTKSINPNRIQIDIPNAKLDPGLKLNQSGEGIAVENSSSISQIRYLLFSKESSIVRIIVDLARKVDFQPSGTQSITQISWSILPAKERYTVVIDPGHGGKDTGALSVANRFEKNFVLPMGTKVFNLLAKEPKIEPVLTRNKDTFVELSGRATIANELKADLFVSIHGNSTVNEEVEGIETYYYSDESFSFAKLMHEKVIKSSGFVDRKVKQDNFYVIKNTTMPSILLELGFLSNKAEEKAMFEDAFQNQVAAAIVAGIKQQLNIE